MTESDWDIIRPLALDLWLESYIDFIPAKDILHYHKQLYTKTFSSFKTQITGGYIAKSRGKSIGYTLHGELNHGFHIQSLYIRKSHHGKGIGTQFLDSSESQAIKQSYKVLSVGVMERNTKALNWYLRHGFSFTGKEIFSMGKTDLDILLGYKLL